MPSIRRATPFVAPIKLQGGSFYTFTSAAEDLTLSFNESSNKKFKFSKFALIDIPDIVNEPLSNSMKLRAIPGAYNSVNFNRTNDWNNHLMESFQNYCLNLETIIISKDSYDASDPHTVSERVFWKWMKELSTLRFDSKTTEHTEASRYVEESDNDYYNRVVQYIGEIDFVNNYSGSENSYSEVYFHVPTDVGNFPYVYFRVREDDNYYPGMSLCRYGDGLDNEFLYGRHYNDSHPAGLDIHSFYDNDTGLGVGSENTSNVTLFKKKINKRINDLTLEVNGIFDIDYDIDKWWYYPTSEANCYYTEPIEFVNPTNDDLAIVEKSATNPNMQAVKFRRSKLDGIELDFDPLSYRSTELGISTLIDNARSAASQDFQFNAILVYYDVYDEIDTTDLMTIDDTLTDKEREDLLPDDVVEYNILSTNLFGILFLDNVENYLSLGGGYIPRFKKCKPNSVLNLNGNAYGFKLNLKLDTSPIGAGVHVETVIANSNTMSMDIYADALNEMRMAMESLQDLTFSNLTLDHRLRNIELLDLYRRESNITEVLNRLNLLENMLSNNTNIDFIKEKSDLLSLINQNSVAINDILNGNIPSNLLLDLDTLKQGDGIIMDRSREGQVKISANSLEYNLGDIIRTSVRNDWEVTEYHYRYEVPLRPMKNYLRLQEDQEFVPNRNLELYINDRNVKWQLGQVFRIYLAQPYQMKNSQGHFIFYLYTGKALPTWVDIGKVTYDEFEERNYRPIIEIICIDDKNLNFVIDLIN